jgi:hypothetical protein
MAKSSVGCLGFGLVRILVGVAMVVVLLFGVVNYLTIRKLSKEYSFCSDKLSSVLNEKKWRVSPSLLTNPVVYEWRGSVKGKLVRKDEHLLVIEKEGVTVEVTDLTASGKWNWEFHRLINGKTDNVSLKDISIGTWLAGDVWAFKETPDKLVGGAFRVLGKDGGVR